VNVRSSTRESLAAGTTVRLDLAYDGTEFAGWQRQPNALAVQQVLEEALEALLGAPVRAVGAGRTDAGVHADGQAVSLVLPRPFAAAGLIPALNHRLPRTVRALGAEARPAGWDARKGARAKLYRYRLVLELPVPPELGRFVVPSPAGTDVDRLEAAARALVGRHDFRAFALAGGAAKTTVRRIFAAGWTRRGAELRFEIVGEGFLRGMVRSLVGTLLEVGTGGRSVEGFATLLGGADRGSAGPTAPAAGLALVAVDDGLSAPRIGAESLW